MEKFMIYSNDPYDFNDFAQIEAFYKALGKNDVVSKITDETKDKIYLKILADKKEGTVEISLIQSRKNSGAKIKLPDLVLDYHEMSLKEAGPYLDLSEYMEFD